MAILDVFTLVSVDQAITATAVSTNAIDLTTTGLNFNLRDVGRGNRICMRLRVSTAFSGGSQLVPYVTAANDQTLLDGPVYLAAPGGAGLGIVGLQASDLPLNAEFIVPVPPIPRHMLAAIQGRRFLGVTYFVAGAAFGAGTVTTDFGSYHGTMLPPVLTTGYRGP